LTGLDFFSPVNPQKGAVEMNQKNSLTSDYIVIKAVEDGVNVIGLTRGTDTKFHHSEKLDKGEVMIAQFTEHTSAIKIRGNAKIITSYGEVESEAKGK
jgi:transcription attenuation protein (tryptophan RNA-binding attenuator protein)